MINKKKKQFLVLLLLLCLLCSPLTTSGRRVVSDSENSILLRHDDIIRQAVSAIQMNHNRPVDISQQLEELEGILNSLPAVEYASLIENSITVKFIDGTYTVLIYPFDEQHNILRTTVSGIHEKYPSSKGGNTAVLLNAAEHLYGHQQCKRIISILLRHKYQIEYLANQAVTISYLRYNLSANIVYLNTHAGYFDIDGDKRADVVVIGTGEPWTNETEQQYAFEYQNNMIVKGMVGEQSYIAFTPSFIEYYYPPQSLPDSLIYMATCYAAFDDSMAAMFLAAGAQAYLGWTQNTVFWTNSRTSVNAFRLFSLGFTVSQVCKIIGYGGFYNWLLQSKLLYYGAGNYQIPR